MKRLFYIFLFAMFIVPPAFTTAATMTPLANGFEPRFSPVTNNIVYAASNIFTVPATGGISMLLIDTGSGSYAPCYFPDGQRVVYNNQNSGNELFIRETDGSIRQLTYNGGRNDDPVVSPDAQWVYFVRDKFGNSTIWRIRTDGSEQHSVVDGWGSRVNSPSISHDGSTLWFSMNLSGTFQIWRTPTNAQDPVQVTAEDGINRYCPVQSPTAPLLAYSGEGGGPLPTNRSGIYTIRLDGQHDTSQTNDPATHPSWSPFGDMITFQRNVGGYQIYLLTNFELPVPTHSTTWGHLKSLYR